MKFTNIEKSKVFKKEYVGYADGSWRIERTNSTYGNWIAMKDNISNITIYAFTLAQLSEKLIDYEKASIENKDM